MFYQYGYQCKTSSKFGPFLKDFEGTQNEVSLLKFKVQVSDRKFDALQSCVAKLDDMARRFDNIAGKAIDWGW